MARLARIVVPDVAHHVIQRGNRRQQVFFGDADYVAYRELVAASCRAQNVRCLAWCLMPNHVHLILVPADPDGLRAALGESHRRYSRRVNRANNWTGYLWQGRFASYPMDDAHLMTAIRYVERNPVAAGLVAEAADWPWSSAGAHIRGRPDGLTDLGALSGAISNWRTMLADGLEAGDLDDAAQSQIERASRTGRPWGSDRFVASLEARTGRTFRPQKRGPKPRPAAPPEKIPSGRGEN